MCIVIYTSNCRMCGLGGVQNLLVRIQYLVKITSMHLKGHACHHGYKKAPPPISNPNGCPPLRAPYFCVHDMGSCKCPIFCEGRWGEKSLTRTQTEEGYFGNYGRLKWSLDHSELVWLADSELGCFGRPSYISCKVLTVKFQWYSSH